MPFFGGTSFVRRAITVNSTMVKMATPMRRYWWAVKLPRG